MKNNTNILTLDRDPFELFNEWYSEAKEKEINDPNATTLSTVGKNLKPSSRMVLMKSFNEKGFIFNTNLNSKKSKEIINNSFVCLNFYWKSLRKQIRVEGPAKILDKTDADILFAERPRGSKIAAWASNQSSTLTSRKELDTNVKKFEKKFKNLLVPRPSYWSGYIVKPTIFEFWQDMPFRLHDRIEYKKNKNTWKVKRLYP
tara:strand:- start:4374 stop:4979 length:606 start_codon:yes stop_codon:yes gene_type:complete